MSDEKTWPAEQQVDLLVCEDVRVETSGKLTLTGFYPARKIVVHDPASKSADEPVAALEVISLVMILQGGTGQFVGRIELFNPDGSQALEGSLGTVQLLPGGTGTVIGKLRPFLVKNFGSQRIRLWLDELSYELTFEVSPAA